MTLKKEILEVLESQDGLKAWEIASKITSKYKHEIGKKDINHLLYNDLSDVVWQNETYQWFLKTKKPANRSVPVTSAVSSLGKLASYYLDCLSRDVEIDVSRYATSRYGSPDYGQIFQLPISEGSQQNDIYDHVDVKNTIKKVRENNKELVLQLGYPVHVRKFTGRTGDLFFVEPLLLIPFETNSFLQGGTPRVSNEIPQFNREAISRLSGLAKGELMNEILSLSSDLGLNNPSEDLPSFDEIFYRLKKLRSRWNWKEEIDPEHLSSKSLKEITDQGIYNCAALFFTERSKYTIGLEKELSDFKNYDISKYSGSILSQWLHGVQVKPITETVLIEPLPLNDEQKEAVKRALQAPLTVVTGPPGTGKSQVVTSIIVNAIFNGQKVLFASKNNKAVDVVFERINGLTSRPVMLRLGNENAESSLVNYLTSLLATKTTSSDIENYNHALKIHKELSSQLNNIAETESRIIKARNLTDQLEQEIEKAGTPFSKEEINEFTCYSDQWITTTDLFLASFKNSLFRADRSKQKPFIKLFWFLFENTRKKELDAGIKQLNDLLISLKIKWPIPAFDMNFFDQTQKLLSEIDTRLKFVQLVVKYATALNTLVNNVSLFELSAKTKLLEEKISANSNELWEGWLNLMPDRISKNRHTIGQYLSLIKMILNARESNMPLENSVYAQYYRLLPEVTNVLSCWAVTSLSAKGKVPFQPGFFDLVIIDEASQCDIASALPLLFRAKRAVIIGDEKQLNHITSINEKQNIQLLSKYELAEGFLNWGYTSNSLFALAQSLCSSEDIILLKDHHRSHAHIITYSNKQFYGGYLRVATNYTKLKTLKNENVIRWIDIKGKVETPSSGGSVNPIEADGVIQELQRLIKIRYEGTIGVVSPFRAQVERINQQIKNDPALDAQLKQHDFLVDTVHKFQGDERDIMIFSPVISEGISQGSISFLSKTGNLFNVAITRARAALVTIGDLNACSSSGIKYMANFVQYTSTINNATISKDNLITDYGPKYPQLQGSFAISDWEKVLYEALYKAGIVTIPQYQVEQYSLDLALISGDRKLDIEVDGERYHKNWDGELCKRDKLRNKRLIELGWDVKRFWVYELKYNLEGCVEMVGKWVGNQGN